MRPSTSSKLLRTNGAIGLTPRNGRLVLASLPFILPSTSTYNSGDRMGLPTRLAFTSLPGAAFLIPGASPTTVTVSTPKPPDSSLVEPARMMMATSSEPLPSSAAWNPAAMDSNAISTSVTPPMPSTATSEDDHRCGILRRFMPVTAAICENGLAMLKPQLRRNASTILRRIAVNAGHAPVINPNTSISAMPTVNVAAPMWNDGK